MKKFAFLLLALIAPMSFAISQTGHTELNAPKQIGSWWCWGLEDTKLIIEYEQKVILCDSILPDCEQEIRILGEIIEAKDDQIMILLDENEATDSLYKKEQQKNSIVIKDNQDLRQENHDLKISNEKLKKSRGGWIIGGVVSISVAAIITTIVIATK